MTSSNEKLEGKVLNELLVSELPAMRRFAYSLTGSVDDANDVVQSAVERCLKSGVPSDRARPWLFRVCKNLWIDEIRRRNRKATDALDEDADTPSQEFSELNGTEANASRREELDEMARALTKLSDDQRIALSMSAIEGLSYEEISIALEIPVGTVMSRIARARVTLNQRLKGGTDDQ